MSKKLTLEEAKARQVVYDEIIGHLEQDIYETPEEREQGMVVLMQIVSLRDKFIRNWNKCVE